MGLVGIAGIHLEPQIAVAADFGLVYDGVGNNTGNLVFSYAVWSHIADHKKQIDYFRAPEKTNDRFSCVVIPAANWIAEDPGIDQTMDRFAAWIETLAIPVVLTGLGVQHVGYEPGFGSRIGAGCRRLLRAVADRSATISVRGAYTAEVLAELGFPGTRVTGCPSISVDMRSFEIPVKTDDLAIRECALCPTRYYTSAAFVQQPSLDREIFRFAYAHGCDLILQSEAEEMEYLSGFSGEQLPAAPLLAELYGADDTDAVQAYVAEKCRVFYRIHEWATAATGYAFSFGTRLHGTIMMLNSGVPAVLATHDSRTREVAEFARIPAVSPTGLRIDEAMLHEAYGCADLPAYYARRLELRTLYRDFLRENGLTPAVEPSLGGLDQGRPG